jgi:hypothetical protein
MKERTLFAFLIKIFLHVPGSNIGGHAFILTVQHSALQKESIGILYIILAPFLKVPLKMPHLDNQDRYGWSAGTNLFSSFWTVQISNKNSVCNYVELGKVNQKRVPNLVVLACPQL